ncbi:homoserine dehydrogenase [Sphingorhabdus sp.]|jgi:homoserine dehydrogenase|uniref:homoserine dehydrogenase n=2 Tax=Sphingorhabdus sp. TaxID=1902408 RepID=UPI003BAEA12B|nr:homoserine dehydrogenase [Sphingomonadales bacterium]MBK9431531.1 homoserine dehydrogenase [Sphingomonadales bacterium]MBL0023177.1 homoserine dehydrogenase [Sphingomonadales bacterium]
MAEPLRIALAGLGTVGTGVIRLLDENRALVARRAGRPIVITAITARERSKDRGVDLTPYRWVDDMGELATADDVDVVVELVGGSDGPALTLARETLGAGRPFVTANKAMIAHHGAELAALAEDTSAALKFEAAVAGGIPVIQGLRDGAAANRIDRVYGILNGTCNFILSAMERDGRDFADVLADAQAKGYAEADPSFDIDGVDAAHKLSILASLSFGSQIDFDGVEIGGIRKILAADIAQAQALGYRIRLIGLAEIDGSNGHTQLFQRVQPVLVPIEHPLANVTGATNAVVAEGNFSGRLLFQGAGAGDRPTASAVVADLVDIARKETGPAFSMPVGELEALTRASSAHRINKTYLRMLVADRAGVLAEIAAAMRDAGLSIESLIQREVADGTALISMVTHEAAELAVTDTLATLAGSASLAGEPMVMPILGE